MKERKRKFIVKLKRKPQTVTLFLLVVCCVVYTFNLSVHSNTVIYTSISEGPSRFVPLFLFCTTLASILGIFTFTSAYPRNQRRLIMVILVYAVLVLEMAMDIGYVAIVQSRVEIYLASGTSRMPSYINESVSWIYVHLACVVLTALSMILMPVYHKKLMSIDTTPV